MKTAFTYSLESEHRRIAFSRRTRFLRSREFVLFLEMTNVTPDRRMRTEMPVMAQSSPRLFICCLMPWLVVMAAHSASLSPFSRMSPGSRTPSHRVSARRVLMSPILCQHHQWNYNNLYSCNDKVEHFRNSTDNI